MNRLRIAELFSLGSHYNQTYARNQRDRAQDWRDGHRLLLLMRDLQRTHVHVLLRVREADSADGEAYHSKDNQKYSNNGCSFHVKKPFTPNICATLVRCLSPLCQMYEALRFDFHPAPGVALTYTGKEDDPAYEY